MARTLTAANSVIMLSVDTLFPVPQQIQGFSVDDVFDSDPVKPAETLMGVDGYLSAGYVPVERVTMITLQADSASNAFFDAWAQAQEQIREVYAATGFVALPGIGTAYVLTRGFLTTYPPTPQTRKILQPRKFGITWNSITPAPV